MNVRLGTRGSRLALVQCEQVAAALRAHGARVEIVVIRTSGDRLAQVALADFGGKALFVKEIEEALLAGQVDVGVHSLKDMPAALPADLVLAAFPPREDPGDVLLTRGPGGWDGLPRGARVGTSSLRRRALVLARRPDLRPEPIRGNVETRIEKLGAGACDATILAAAGLRRLGLAPPHLTVLPVEEFVPAVGQGILAVEAREADREMLELLLRLDDTRSRSEAVAERTFLERLGADCHTPVAGHAHHDGSALTLTGIVASLDGVTVLRCQATGGPREAEQIGARVAGDLLAKGAKAAELLEAAGARVLLVPTIAIEPPDSWAPLDAALADDFAWAIFTSVNGVTMVRRRVAAIGQGRALLERARLAAIGPATAAALAEWGLRPAVVPDEYVAEALVERLRPLIAPGERVLLPRAAETRDLLVRELSALGAVVTEVPAYRTRSATEQAPGLREALAEGRVDVVTFTSSSTVRSFCALFGPAELPRLMAGVTVACIGPITRATAQGRGLEPRIVPEDYTIPGLARAIVAHFEPARS